MKTVVGFASLIFNFASNLPQGVPWNVGSRVEFRPRLAVSIYDVVLVCGRIVEISLGMQTLVFSKVHKHPGMESGDTKVVEELCTMVAYDFGYGLELDYDVIETDKVGYVLLFEFLIVEEHLERFLTLPLDTILLAEDGEAFLIDGFGIAGTQLVVEFHAEACYPVHLLAVVVLLLWSDDSV